MLESNRRTFLISSIVGTLLSAVCGVGYVVVRYLSPASQEAGQSKVTISESDMPPTGARFFEYRGSTAVLIKKTGGGLVAFSAVCSHLGCIVQWQKERQEFLCPCHAGRYRDDGTVISGPPPKPLTPLNLTIENGMITIS